MKTIQPQRRHDDTYPSVIDVHLSRREFFRSAAGTSAAVAGVLLAGDRADAAAPSQPQHKVVLRQSKRYQFRYGNYEVQKIVAQTSDSGLARYLLNQRHAVRIEDAVRKVLDRHTCADLQNGKRLARLQAQVGRALASLYRRQMRRKVPTPTVVLYVGVQAVSCLGDCPAPVPICKPPQRPARRPRR